MPTAAVVIGWPGAAARRGLVPRNRRGEDVKVNTPDAVNSVDKVAAAGSFVRIDTSRGVSETARRAGISTSSRILGGGLGLALRFAQK